MIFRKPSNRTRAILAGAILFGLCGLCLFPLMLWRHQRVLAMGRWAAADAVVESASVHSNYVLHEGKRYEQAISYRYSVDGRSFAGSRLWFGDEPPSWGTEGEARRTLPTAGSRIGIHYSPGDPSDSVVHVIDMAAGRRLMLEGFSLGVGILGGIAMLASAFGDWKATD